MSEKKLLVVPDMTCGGCKANVCRALGAVEGVQGVEADVPSRQVWVELANDVPVEALKEAVAKAGYTVAE